jgi:hypothetical protein
LDADTNVHARNLKLISISFILYWLLGLEQTDDAIRLGILPYIITNPEWLPWLAHILLSYFIWRYWIHTNPKRTLLRHLISQQVMDDREVLKATKYNLFWRLFNSRAIQKYKVQIDAVKRTERDELENARIHSIHFSSNRYRMTLIVTRKESGSTVGVIKSIEERLHWNDFIFFRLGLIIRNFFKRETEQDRVITWMLAWIAILFSIFNNFLNLLGL